MWRSWAAQTPRSSLIPAAAAKQHNVLTTTELQELARKVIGSSLDRLKQQQSRFVSHLFRFTSSKGEAVDVLNRSGLLQVELRVQGDEPQLHEASGLKAPEAANFSTFL